VWSVDSPVTEQRIFSARKVFSRGFSTDTKLNHGKKRPNKCSSAAYNEIILTEHCKDPRVLSEAISSASLALKG
jgi:hypothetical protein